MIDKLAVKDADSPVYLPEPRYDMHLLEAMKQVIAEDPGTRPAHHPALLRLISLYHQRYPRESARFLPDDNVAINRKNVEKLVNAYDNSIYYTDHFLSQTIEYLRSLENDCSALLYCADHGEDILDDERERFLHASPTTTFYQLYVANLGWFSPEYRREFPEKVEAARNNESAPATTHSMFQSMADIASIEGDFIDPAYSLVSPTFDYRAPRRYLNDHNLAVPFPKTGLSDEDLENFRRHGIDLSY